jgi:hypothetical protein
MPQLQLSVTDGLWLWREDTMLEGDKKPTIADIREMMNLSVLPEVFSPYLLRALAEFSALKTEAQVDVLCGTLQDFIGRCRMAAEDK